MLGDDAELPGHAVGPEPGGFIRRIGPVLGENRDLR
jgi:hypothetical protein